MYVCMYVCMYICVCVCVYIYIYIYIYIYTVNDLLNARAVYLVFVLKGGRLIDTRRLLEGGVYFLSKVTHSNHYRNKLTALLNSNNFKLEQDTISKPLIQRGR